MEPSPLDSAPEDDLAATRTGRRGASLDRFTLGIAGATLGLIALALGLVLTRPSDGRPMDESTPLGVVNNYYLALAGGDTRRAYDYLTADARAKTPYEEFARRQPPWREGRRVRLDDERIDGDTSRVTLHQTHGSRGFFPFGGGEYTAQRTVVLRREGGAWRIAQADYHY